MGPSRRIRRSPSETLDQLVQLLLVGSEFDWGSAPGLLIQFRSGPEAMRPGDRRPEGKPFHQQTRGRDRTGLRRALTHVKPEGVAQMADHVVSGHGTPAPLAGWLD